MKLRRQTQSALNFHQVVNTNERILPSSIVEQERSSCLRLKIFKIEYFLGEGGTSCALYHRKKFVRNESTF